MSTLHVIAPFYYENVTGPNTDENKIFRNYFSQAKFFDEWKRHAIIYYEILILENGKIPQEASRHVLPATKIIKNLSGEAISEMQRTCGDRMISFLGKRYEEKKDLCEWLIDRVRAVAFPKEKEDDFRFLFAGLNLDNGAILRRANGEPVHRWLARRDKWKELVRNFYGDDFKLPQFVYTKLLLKESELD